MLSKRIWKVTARLRGIVITEMEIYETGEKTFAIAKEEILIFLKIRLTAESPLEMVKKILVIGVIAGVIAEKIIRIAREIGVTTEKIFRATEDTEVTREEISGVTGDTEVTREEIFRVTEDTEVTREEIFRVTGGSGEIIKGISEPIVKFDGITNNIIPHGQIIGSDILPSVTGINIQVDHTKEEARVKLTDVRFLPVEKKTAAT
jgi:hypothetical protein